MKSRKTLEEFFQICESIQPDEYGCHLYPGRTPDCYVIVRIEGCLLTAHRLVLEKKLGRPIRSRYLALLHCNTKSCVNPDHIYEGTLLESLRKRVLTSRWNRIQGAESEVCPYFHDKPVPAYVYVLPFRIRRANSSRKCYEMNKLLRNMPHGIFCYECYQRHREIIESATEALGLWNLTREIENYVKGKR